MIPESRFLLRDMQDKGVTREQMLRCKLSVGSDNVSFIISIFCTLWDRPRQLEVGTGDSASRTMNEEHQRSHVSD